MDTFSVLIVVRFLTKQFHAYKFIIENSYTYECSYRIKHFTTSLVTVQKATIHQITTMLATSKNVLIPAHNHLLTTDADDHLLAGAQAIIKVSGHQYRWLADGYDLEVGHFRTG